MQVELREHPNLAARHDQMAVYVDGVLRAFCGRKPHMPLNCIVPFIHMRVGELMLIRETVEREIGAVSKQSAPVPVVELDEDDE